jgi:hypothetical protein
MSASYLDLHIKINNGGNLKQKSTTNVILTLKKKIMNTGVLDFFNKKLILDYYFCLKSGPVFLFQMFIVAPLPLPRDIKLYH